MKKTGFPVFAFLISGCAFLPGRYLYETHFVRQASDEIDGDFLRFIFSPEHSEPSKDHIVYGNPYTLDIVLYSKRKRDGVSIAPSGIILDNGRKIPLPREFPLVLICDSSTGEGLEGRKVYSSEERPRMELPYGAGFKIEFWMKSGAKDSTKAVFEFDWKRDREHKSKYISGLFSV